MVEKGSAEIALGSMAGPFEKLHNQRPVEAVILRNDGDIGCAGVGARDRRGQVAGKACQDEADDQNGQAHQGGQQQSAEYKQSHCRKTTIASGSLQVEDLEQLDWRHRNLPVFSAYAHNMLALMPKLHSRQRLSFRHPDLSL